jgi:hypothetical protein
MSTKGSSSNYTDEITLAEFKTAVLLADTRGQTIRRSHERQIRAWRPAVVTEFVLRVS